MKRQFVLITACILLAQMDSFAKAPQAPMRNRDAAPTAFSALPVAQQYAPEGSQAKMLAIIGPRSRTALTPTTWEFLYWNPGGWKNLKRVTVIGGQVRDVREGVIEIGRRGLVRYKESQAFDPSRLKVDSDRALQVILRTGAVGKATLSTVLFELARTGDEGEPSWQMRFYADRRGVEADIGVARVGAVSGKILELRLNPSRATDGA
ncbi:hypothetical protein [Methylacidimicrobium sp. B4]|uniref:hypothetical protein n=1 Tax=Methylacidimicrobium sp. B4 TaxID=2796139 RepID=UPI001A8E3786|nr:hypothetical protein [Methylacidimicrobium sp. B4]QSR84005.1 hypothetical protein MacB4_06985 [Methylacidimicrobium sp. B4]